MPHMSPSVNVSNDIWDFNQSFFKSDDAFLPYFVHPYWSTFDLNRPIFKATSGILIGLVALCAIIGNGLVAGIFLRFLRVPPMMVGVVIVMGGLRSIYRIRSSRLTSSKALQTPPNLFAVNMAISDMAFSLVSPLKTISSFYGYWNWGKVVCVITGFWGGLFGFAALNTAVMISIDRYLVIVQPCKSTARMSHRRVSLMIAVVWLWSLFWSSPPFYGFGRYIPDGLQTSCSFDYLTANVKNYIHVAGMYTFEFLISICILFFCYIQIVLVVKRNAREMAHFMRNSFSGRSRSMPPCRAQKRADVQTAKVSAIIVSIFIISWLPYATLAFLSLNGFRNWLTPIAAEVALFFAKSSAIYNPLVYALMNAKFRFCLIKRMSCLIKCCHCSGGQAAAA